MNRGTNTLVPDNAPDEDYPVPVVACPKCPTKLKVPDGATGNTRCPKCGAVFPVGAGTAPKPAFEVVDDAPPKKPAAGSAAKPAIKPAAKPKPPEPDFEVIDDKPKKRIVVELDDYDDEDEAPRKKKAKKRYDDDDDGEGDRPRAGKKDKKAKKKSRDYDEDEDDFDDYDDRPRPKPGFGAAKVGMLIVSISLWVYAGTFALHALLVFMVWLGAVIPNGLLIVPGLLGVTNWVAGLVGLGFCIAGPAKARGLAIAAISVSAVHVILVFVIANDRDSGFFSDGTVEVMSVRNRYKNIEELSKAAQKNPNGPEAKELKEMADELRGKNDDPHLSAVQYAGGQIKDDDWRELKKERPNEQRRMRWLDAATLMPFADKFGAVLAYQSGIFTEYVLSLAGGLLEVARLILVVLLIAAVARAARDEGAARKAAGLGLIGVIAAAVLAILLTLIVFAIYDGYAGGDKKAAEKSAERFKDLKSPDDFKKEVEKLQSEAESREAGRKAVICLSDLALLGLHGGALLLPAFLALSAARAAGRRAR